MAARVIETKLLDEDIKIEGSLRPQYLKEYIGQKKAKEILSTRKYKVYEVGEMVGIEEPSYFTHVFMKYEGYSPSEFMNRIVGK